MKIYRRVVPKIAKDIIRTLLASKAIEIEDGHRDEAELDVAAVFVTYLNSLDQLSNEAHEALQRHKLPTEMYGRVKMSLAEQRNVVMGDAGFDHVLEKLNEALFDSKHVEEVFAEDNELNTIVRDSVRKYLGVDEELDREVRGRLRNLREGTAEWEVEYGRLIDQMRTTSRSSAS